jgi:hypothetical protein
MVESPNKSSSGGNVCRSTTRERFEHRAYRTTLCAFVDEWVIAVHVAQASLKAERSALQQHESMSRSAAFRERHRDRESELERHIESRYRSGTAPRKFDAAEIVHGEGVSPN